MVYVRLWGQLGNHMFQYAAAQAVAQRLGCGVSVYSSFAGRSAIANAFRTRPKYDLLKVFPNLPFSNMDRIWSLYRGLAVGSARKKKPYFVSDIFYEDDFLSGPEINHYRNFSDISDRTLMIGSFQSEKYFKDEKDIICKLYRPTDLIKSQIENATQSLPVHKQKMVAVHVRLGDYYEQIGPNASSGSGWVLNENYYEEALSLFHANTPIALFSNDLANARKYLPRKPAWESPSFSSGFDLHMMSSFNKIIIANSSFSWWSAWLNQETDRIIVGPKYHIGRNNKKWFPPEIEVDGWIYV